MIPFLLIEVTDPESRDQRVSLSLRRSPPRLASFELSVEVDVPFLSDPWRLLRSCCPEEVLIIPFLSFACQTTRSFLPDPRSGVLDVVEIDPGTCVCLLLVCLVAGRKESLWMERIGRQPSLSGSWGLLLPFPPRHVWCRCPLVEITTVEVEIALDRVTLTKMASLCVPPAGPWDRRPRRASRLWSQRSAIPQTKASDKLRSVSSL